MAYVKLMKTGGDFDMIPAENAATVKLLTTGAALGKIEVNYLSDLANEFTIIPYGWVVGTVATHFTQKDVTGINTALTTISGGTGSVIADIKKVGEVTYLADA